MLKKLIPAILVLTLATHHVHCAETELKNEVVEQQELKSEELKKIEAKKKRRNKIIIAAAITTTVAAVGGTLAIVNFAPDYCPTSLRKCIPDWVIKKSAKIEYIKQDVNKLCADYSGEFKKDVNELVKKLEDCLQDIANILTQDPNFDPSSLQAKNGEPTVANIIESAKQAASAFDSFDWLQDREKLKNHVSRELKVLATQVAEQPQLIENTKNEMKAILPPNQQYKAEDWANNEINATIPPLKPKLVSLQYLSQTIDTLYKKYDKLSAKK